MHESTPLPGVIAKPGLRTQKPLLIGFLLALALMAALTFCSRTAIEPAPMGQETGWQLVFEDTFEGDALDSGKWVTCYWWDDQGCTNLGNKELEWYLPENVSVGEGVLRLRAQPQVTVRPEATYDYSSGMVTTGRRTYERTDPPKFEFQYGYAEARARVPVGKGLWPAFWLLPSRQIPLPEIDVMEVLGHEPDELHFNFHYRDTLDNRRKVGTAITTPELSQAWHTYAVEWSPESIVWYFDGVEQWRYESAAHVPHEPMYLILNLAVGGAWAGAPDEATRFPADLLVDHVRVWQRGKP